MNNNFQSTIEYDIDEVIMNVPSWDHFSGQAVLVTGANGFLGSYFVRVLLRLNTKGVLREPVFVQAGVRDMQKGRERFSDVLELADFSLVSLDLAKIAVPALGNVDYIIHAASHASPRFYGTDPIGTILPNSVGTAALLSATADSGLKGFLFVSTSEVYGSADSAGGYAESTFGDVDPINPRSCYAESKRMGEAMCVAWHEQLNIPTYVVRPFHTYGPGLSRNDGRVFADFIFNAVNRENIVIRGDGAARRAFCYVTDAISGMFTVLCSGEVATAYNVANPSGECSVEELARLIVGLFPEYKLEVKIQSNSHIAGYLPSASDRVVPDVSRLLGLGWSPDIPPSKGFKRTIEAYL